MSYLDLNDLDAELDELLVLLEIRKAGRIR